MFLKLDIWAIKCSRLFPNIYHILHLVKHVIAMRYQNLFACFVGVPDVLQKMHHYVVHSPMFVLDSHLVCKPLMQGPSNPDKGFFK